MKSRFSSSSKVGKKKNYERHIKLQFTPLNIYKKERSVSPGEMKSIIKQL